MPYADARGREPPTSALAIILGFALRHRWPVIFIPILVTVALATSSLFGPRSWTAGAAFIPQAPSTGVNLTGIAAQLGLNLGTPGDAQGPLFYAEVLRSRAILHPVVETTYTVTSDTGVFQGNLTMWYGAGGDSPQARTELAARWLNESIGVNTGLRTGIVRYSVRTTNPQLSYRIAESLLERLNAFNLSGRQSRATQEREFAARRLGEARGELRALEDRLAGFLSRNRAFTATNALSFEEERLRRDITFKAEVVATLAEAHERSRLDEIRDIPVITVLEQPMVPGMPDSRGIVRLFLVGLLTTMALGIIGVLAIGAVRNVRMRRAGGTETSGREVGWRESGGAD
ncbi:MAG: hypothetical protein ACT4OZ_07910 [Gemmatimonadota bacterium]